MVEWKALKSAMHKMTITAAIIAYTKSDGIYQILFFYLDDVCIYNNIYCLNVWKYRVSAPVSDSEVIVIEQKIENNNVVGAASKNSIIKLTL